MQHSSNEKKSGRQSYCRICERQKGRSKTAERKKQYKHYCYKITNLINHKFYIGKRSTHLNINDDTYMGSSKIVDHAIAKYGIKNFKKEILKVFDTEKEAYDYEQELVTDELIANPNCYNVKCGGHGGVSGENNPRNVAIDVFDLDGLYINSLS